MSLRAFEKLINPLQRRVKNMVARGFLNRLGVLNGLQRAQVTFNNGEVSDDGEVFQPYGIHGLPPLGCHVAGIFIGGNRDHPLIIGMDDAASRKQAVDDSGYQPEDMLIYTRSGNWIRLTAEDEKLYLKTGGNVLLKSEGVIRLEGDEIELKANTRIKVDAGGRGYNYYATHTDSWEEGSTPGSSNPIAPPEHPPVPSETLPE